MVSRHPCKGSAILGVALGHTPGRLCGDTLAMSGVATCGAGVKYQLFAYDTSSRLLVCDDPSLRILCCMGALVVANVLWISCGWHVVSAFVLPLYYPFSFLFIQIGTCFVPLA